VTASADKTVKTWDSSSGKLVNSWSFGKAIGNMQVGLNWGKSSGPISLSLNGTLNFLDENGDQEKTISIHGHHAPIYKVCVDKNNNKMYSCGSEETIVEWEVGKMKTRLMSGDGHKGIVSYIALAGDYLVSAGADSIVKFTPIDKFEFTKEKVKLEGGINDISVSDDGKLVVISTKKGVYTFKDQKQDQFYQTNFEVTSCTLNPKDNTQIAVGGSDKKVVVFTMSGDKLKEVYKQKEAIHKGNITRMRFSPDGKLLAVGDSNREIVVYDSSDFSVVYDGLVYHTSTVTDLDWSSDSKYLLSSSLDKCAIVWDLAGKQNIKNICHFNSVKSVAFIDDNTFVTASDDYCLKTWGYSF
jgi:WD repeat-containing protein 1 (actin-interacting protein 1)